MKKIFMMFLLCFAVLSSNVFANNDPWIQKVNLEAILNVLKTTNVKQYMEPNKFIEYIEKHWEPTFQDLLDACKVSVSQDVEKNCKTFFFDVVAEHNRLIDNTNLVDQVSESENKQGMQNNSVETPSDVSVIKIRIDLDGGTPVDGNCANEIVIKSGTPVKLNCDAVKNGEHLSGYVDNNGYKVTKNWQFGFNGELPQEAINGGAVPLSLKAEYGEKHTLEKVSGQNSDKSEQKKDVTYSCTGSKIMHSAAEAQTSAELGCVSELSAAKLCRGNHNMLGTNTVCDSNTRKCVYACMLNKMDFTNRKYKTICCDVSSSSDNVVCNFGKEGTYNDVWGPDNLSMQDCSDR